jgi:muramoyltetrapeptide carboxypeptidase LdcA involved in peptidoglycan recycling
MKLLESSMSLTLRMNNVQIVVAHIITSHRSKFYVRSDLVKMSLAILFIAFSAIVFGAKEAEKPKEDSKPKRLFLPLSIDCHFIFL